MTAISILTGENGRFSLTLPGTSMRTWPKSARKEGRERKDGILPLPS